MTDATLDEMLPQVRAIGADVCRATINNELRRLMLTYKKSNPCVRAGQTGRGTKAVGMKIAAERFEP